MLIGKRSVTQAEFLAFVTRLDNADRTFERIDGEIVEKMPSFGYSSSVAARLLTLIGAYLLTRDIAHLTDAQGGYDIDDDHTFAPDIGVILKSRLSDLPRDAFIPLAPDLAIEVVSASDLTDAPNRIERKKAAYLQAGVPLLWYVYPERREVEIYRPGQAMVTATAQDTLSAEDILPGFTIAVRQMFP